MYKWLKKHIDPIIPFDCIIPLLSCFALNMIVYSGAIAITKDWHKYDFTTSFDQKVPVIPWFVYIYLGCYLFWIANYILVGRLDKEHFYRFVTSDMLSRLVCGVFFLVIPTTNIRPEITGNALSEILMRFLYHVDAPANLFPSIHCLVSWFCYIGIRGRKEIPAWYRGFSCVFAIAVMISTQVTKQHYFIDVIGGVALAEIVYFISGHCSLYQYVMKFYDFIHAKIKQLLLKEQTIGKQEKNNI